MTVALEVFVADGYHKASISKISRQAGISKGLLYNYFPSKEDLLKSVLLHGIDEFKHSFDTISQEFSTSDSLEIFIKGGLKLMRNESHSFKLYFAVMFQPEAYQAIKEYYPRVIDALIQGIVAYFKSKGDPHPLEKAMLLGAMMDGIGMYYIMDPGMYDLDVIEKIIYDLFK